MEKSEQPFAVVYFASCRRTNPRRLLRLYGWLIRTLTRSGLAHVCVGVDGRVVDKTPDGINFRSMVGMIEYPSLVAIDIVPLNSVPDVSDFIARADEKVSPWPTILKFLSRGMLPRKPLTDCLATTTTILNRGDVALSSLRGCYSIGQFYKLLRRKGYATYTITHPGRFVRAVWDAGLHSVED